MHIFYSPDANLEKVVVLDKEESRHLVKVLRMREGEDVLVTNGKGLMAFAKITSLDTNQVALRILKEKTDFPQRTFSIHLAVAPTKNADRMEWFVEKAVELGIEEISFIQTMRSERKVINIERIQKIAIAAMKQSEKPLLPTINEMVKFAQFLKKDTGKGKFIAHLEQEERKHLKNTAVPNSSYCVLIGPEGDFTEEEILLAKEKGFIPVSLGEYRLRTETAAVAACHILNLVNT